MLVGPGRLMFSAAYTLLAFWLLKLAVGLVLVTMSELQDGNVWAPVLLPAALASAFLGVHATQRMVALARR